MSEAQKSKNNRFGEFVGVSELYIAEVTVDTDTAFTTGTPEYLAPVAEVSSEAEVNSTPTYYDNLPFNNYVSEGVTTLGITVSNLPADIIAKLTGKHFEEGNGLVYDTGEPKPQMYAVGFRYDMGPQGYRYYWYMKGTFAGGTEEAATKTADMDVRNYALTYTSLATSHKWEIDGEDKPLKRIYGDTSSENFVPTGWFENVVTPDTAG